MKQGSKSFGGFTAMEEILNASTHGIGAILSLLGFAFLVGITAMTHHAIALISCIIYGGSLSLLYLSSSIYHAARHIPTKRFFHMLDHCSIFLVIAGTYTPFALLSVEGWKGTAMLIAIWSIAIAGIAMRLFAIKLFDHYSMALYMAMGWLALLILKPIWLSTGNIGVGLLLGGGLAYTGGVLFYVWNKLPYNHAIWHILVMCGSGLHFYAIYNQVIAKTI